MWITLSSLPSVSGLTLLSPLSSPSNSHRSSSMSARRATSSSLTSAWLHLSLAYSERRVLNSVRRFSSIRLSLVVWALSLELASFSFSRSARRAASSVCRLQESLLPCPASATNLLASDRSRGRLGVAGCSSMAGFSRLRDGQCKFSINFRLCVGTYLIERTFLDISGESEIIDLDLWE